jgi:hypothetical protein
MPHRRALTSDVAAGDSRAKQKGGTNALDAESFASSDGLLRQQRSIAWPGLAEMKAVMFKDALAEEVLPEISTFKYMDVQWELVPMLRERLARWIICVNGSVGMPSDVAYVAIRLFDALAMRHRMIREDAMVYAAVCHIISAKMHVRACPPLSQYRLEERARAVCLCECEVTCMLHGRLMVPTLKGFLRLFQEPYEFEHVDRVVIGFVTDVAALAFDMLDYRPSLVAMAVLALGAAAVGRDDWARDVLERSRALECPHLLPAMQKLQVPVIAAAEDVRRSGRPEAVRTLDRARLPVDLATLGF